MKIDLKSPGLQSKICISTDYQAGKWVRGDTMVMMACPLLGSLVQDRLLGLNSQVSTSLFGNHSIDYVQLVMSLDAESTLLRGMHSIQRTDNSSVRFPTMQRDYISILVLQGPSSKTSPNMDYILLLVCARLTSKSELTSATHHSNLILSHMLRTHGSKPGATYNR